MKPIPIRRTWNITPMIYASQGYNVNVKLGFGNPKRCIPSLVKAFDADLLVMGSHGHRMMKDLIYRHYHRFGAARRKNSGPDYLNFTG